MAYTPDPTDAAAPLNTEKASSAAAEFRALKSYIQTAIAKLAGNVFTGDITLEYAAPTLTVAGDTGASTLILGNKTGGGSAGPVVVNSLDRAFSISHGTAFDKALGGTLTQRVLLGSDGRWRFGPGSQLDTYFEVNAGLNDLAMTLITTGATSAVSFKDAASTANRPFVGSAGDSLVFGRVGIGEYGRISAGRFALGVTAFATDEMVRIHKSTGSKLVLSDSSNFCYISSAVVGPNSVLAFGTDGAEKMRLTPAGLDLSVGAFYGNGSGLTNVTAVSAATAGSALTANSATTAISATTALTANNATTATTAATANSLANTLTFGSGLAAGSFNGSGNVTISVDSATASTASKIVMRDASGDVYGRGFVANNTDVAAGNVLDWYLEGTFTPTLVGAGTPSYATRSGKFTRIGNIVHFEIRLAWNLATPQATFQVSGLPYNASGTGAINIRFGWDGTAANRNMGTAHLGADFSGTTVSLLKSADSASESSLVALAAADSVVISGTYFV